MTRYTVTISRLGDPEIEEQIKTTVTADCATDALRQVDRCPLWAFEFEDEQDGSQHYMRLDGDEAHVARIERAKPKFYVGAPPPALRFNQASGKRPLREQLQDACYSCGRRGPVFSFDGGLFCSRCYNERRAHR